MICMVELTQKQRKDMEKNIAQFKAFLETEEAKEWEKEREERPLLFKRLLSEEHIRDLTEDDFGSIIKSLWASVIWRNKEYLINKILKDNGIQKLRQELKELLYGARPLNERYDRFRGSIKGLGGSSITEILVFTFPDKYCLWNEKARRVMPLLQLEDLLPVRIAPSIINGDQYARCNEVFELIRQELSVHGIEKPDFLDVDLFLWFLFDKILRKKKVIVEREVEVVELVKKISEHEEAEGILLELGNLVGVSTFVTAHDKSKVYKG